MRRNGVLNIWDGYVSSRMQHRVESSRESISLLVAEPILCVMSAGAVAAVVVLAVELCTKRVGRILGDRNGRF
jgi:hypothetical protein